MNPLAEIQSYDLRTTSRGKLVCPACGHAGWGERWWTRHSAKAHTACEDCGRAFVSIRAHRNAGCPGIPQKG